MSVFSRYEHYICAYNFLNEQQFISLVCKCNKLLLGTRIGSVVVSKQYICSTIKVSVYATKLIADKFILDYLLKREWIQSGSW